MPTDARDSRDGSGGAGRTGRARQRWFARNRSGPGWHPVSGQGRLVILVPVSAVVTVVAALRTGLL